MVVCVAGRKEFPARFSANGRESPKFDPKTRDIPGLVLGFPGFKSLILKGVPGFPGFPGKKQGGPEVQEKNTVLQCNASDVALGRSNIFFNYKELGTGSDRDRQKFPGNATRGQGHFRGHISGNRTLRIPAGMFSAPAGDTT